MQWKISIGKNILYTHSVLYNTIIVFHKSTRIEPNDLDNHNNWSSNCSSNKVYHNGGGKWYALLSFLKPNFVRRYLTESNVSILLADKLIQDFADINICTKFEDIRSRTANTGVWIHTESSKMDRRWWKRMIGDIYRRIKGCTVRFCIL